MLPAAKIISAKTKVRPRVLVVDDEPGLVEMISEVVAGLDCKVITARSLSQARRALSRGNVELLLTDVKLPDGDGMSLLASLHKHKPTATAIVMTGSPSVDGAISAIRGGAIDFVAKPFNNNHLVDRIRMALEQQSIRDRQQKRMTRLREAVRKLGTAKRMVSQKVDLLCNDLVGAYGDLSKQVDLVRTEESFRKQLDQSKDLEQLLCHTMDWLIRQLGYANVGLWLAGDEGTFQLGAYMKYTIAGDDPVVEAMQNGILPGTMKDGFMHSPGEYLRDCLPAAQFEILAKQDILGIACNYLAEPLAAVMFFRDSETPFTDNDVATLKAVAPLLATALASKVREPNPHESMEDGDLLDPDGPKAKVSDDWWKKGDRAPF